MATQNADTGGTRICYQLDSTTYTWADTRNASTGNGFVLISPTTTSTLARLSISRGSNWQICRVFIKFDLSGVSGTITDLDLVLKTSATSINFNTMRVVESDATWNIGNDDYGSIDFSTPYSNAFTISGVAETNNTIALNSDAISAANTNSELKIAVIDNQFDYSNNAPTGDQNVTSFYYYTTNKYPYLSYTAVTGYGNTVTGVVSANIGEVTGVATANIGKVIGVQ